MFVRSIEWLNFLSIRQNIFGVVIKWTCFANWETLVLYWFTVDSFRCSCISLRKILNLSQKFKLMHMGWAWVAQKCRKTVKTQRKLKFSIWIVIVDWYWHVTTTGFFIWLIIILFLVLKISEHSSLLAQFTYMHLESRSRYAKSTLLLINCSNEVWSIYCKRVYLFYAKFLHNRFLDYSFDFISHAWVLTFWIICCAHSEVKSTAKIKPMVRAYRTKPVYRRD